MLLGQRIMFGVCDGDIVLSALEGADIVHFILPFALSVGVRDIAHQMSIPCVASFACIPEDVLSKTRPRLRFIKNRLYRRWQKRFYRRINDTHCPSAWIADRLRAHGYTSALHVIGNASAADMDEMTALYDRIIATHHGQESDTAAHKIHLPQTLSLKLDEHYAFVNRNVLFVIFSCLFKYAIIYPIFFTATKLILGYKAKGRHNLRQIKNGAITVSNHVHILDAPMLTFSLFPRQPVITSIKGNFETPGVSFLVRTLGAAPIPETPKALGAFMRAMGNELGRGRVVHFYPEASLWPGHTELRPFKNGAFHLAVTTGKPIVPMVVKPREPYGLLGLIKKKPCITIEIGAPITVPQSGTKRQRIDAMRNTVHGAMAAMLGSDSSTAHGYETEAETESAAAQ